MAERTNFDANINVSVFETNIRIVGGLLSAHLMAKRAGVQLEKGTRNVAFCKYRMTITESALIHPLLPVPVRYAFGLGWICINSPDPDLSFHLENEKKEKCFRYKIFLLQSDF